MNKAPERREGREGIWRSPRCVRNGETWRAATAAMVGFEYSSSWLHWIVIVSYTVILLYYIFWNFTLCLVLLWRLPCQIKSYSHHIHCCGRYVPNVACAWDVLRCGDFSRTGPKVHGHWEMPRFLVLETMGLSMLSVSSCGRVSDPSSCSEFCYARICLSLKENPVGFL